MQKKNSQEKGKMWETRGLISLTHVRRDLLEPLICLLVEVDLARKAKVLGGLDEVAQKSEDIKK